MSTFGATSSSPPPRTHARSGGVLETSKQSFYNFIVEVCYGKYSSFKIYKPQVQGVSLSTWGVVPRELCSNYQNSLGRLKLGRTKGDKKEN